MSFVRQGTPPEHLLETRFHITTGFYPGQRDIIDRLIQGKRVLAIQRTGWGKSLCYQLASCYYPHLTLGFAPLKALMRFLASYLGDEEGYRCNACARCRPEAFPALVPSEGMQKIVARFLDEECLPRIEKGGGSHPSHEAGWSLAYHGNSNAGRLIRLSKYEGGGAFSEELVKRAVQVIRERYPIADLAGIVSVPPTRSGTQVETFARQVATLLHLPYIAAVSKIRPTQEQTLFKLVAKVR